MIYLITIFISIIINIYLIYYSKDVLDDVPTILIYAILTLSTVIPIINVALPLFILFYIYD